MPAYPNDDVDWYGLDIDVAMSQIPPANLQIAAMLREAAELLQAQDADPFRVGAYRRGAETLEGLQRGVDEILRREGPEGLTELRHIGSGLAGAIREILQRGRWGLLERLRGEVEPEKLFQTIPGVGPELAERLHDELHVDTLEALEMAAHDGRLERVEGIGTKRAAGIRASLAAMLGRHPRRSVDSAAPPIGVLLAVDREYRRGAAAGELPTIAPRRFNPGGKQWLPILHSERDGWHFTALYSNTARAHRLGKTDDWVVLYFYDDDHLEGQATVVTETRSELEGRRVVRGRERECARFYAGQEAG